MPHVGKFYPYLPARDLSKYAPSFLSLLPLGLYVHLEGAVDLTWTPWNNTNHASSLGVWDYINGNVTYHCHLGFIVPNSYDLYITWSLTNDGNVGRWRWRLDTGNATPYCVDTGLLSAQCQGNQTSWVNPSIPQTAGVNRGYGNGSFARPLTWPEAKAAYGDNLPLRFPS